VVAGLFVLGAWWLSGAGPVTHLDLVEHLPNATQQRPSPESFMVQDIPLAGETKRSIYVAAPSRLIFTEVVPQDAWLSLSLGVREAAWTREGSAVLFMVGVSHNGRYEELVSLVVNPAANPADRQWLPVLLDLSPWEGQQVEIILNTREPHAGAGVANHLAVWGAPAIVTR
jgi:hypothetical protein